MVVWVFETWFDDKQYYTIDITHNTVLLGKSKQNVIVLTNKSGEAKHSRMLCML